MKRKVFTMEFKLEAVRLLESSGRAASEVARELGIRRNQLYKWQAESRSRGARAAFGSPSSRRTAIRPRLPGSIVLSY